LKLIIFNSQHPKQILSNCFTAAFVRTKKSRLLS